MKVYLASDHAGFFLKEKVRDFLQKQGYSVEDLGAYKEDADDDYPDFIKKVAQIISTHPYEKGIVIGGDGEGEAMVANKFPGVRAGVFYGGCLPVSAIDITGTQSDDPFAIVRLTRQHNDANILSIGARFLNQEDALRAIMIWLETKFSKEKRHVRRIAKIEHIERTR
jgi:ribose 5-phosphate isomerase B